MCGICGIFDSGTMDPMPRHLVEQMNDTLCHRGPDDEGIFVGPGIGLGHRRLSIIDLASGHQPLSNEDGSIWVLLNGEIYNYAELRSELLGKGHRFATNSDTEAIVHLYEEYGEDVFARLRGMFAIAVWDSRRRRLLLARDRVGKKPLFYCYAKGRVLFGSELKAIVTDLGVSRDLDTEAVCDYFSLGYVPAPKSIYKAVRKVLPGHYLEISGQGLRDRQYWDLSFAHLARHSEQEWCEIIREELREATRVRLMSEVPLGAFLSGGVDSSAVVAMMSAASGDPPTTCSIGFAEDVYDERQYSRLIAEQLHTKHYEEVVEPNALEVVDKLVWHYDEPFADSSAVPTYYVSKIARQHVTVALGGDGGDENFAGYRRYRFDRFENRVRSVVPAALRRPLFGTLGHFYPPLAWAPRVLRGRATFQSLARSPVEGYFNSVSIFRPDEKARVLDPDFKSTLNGYDSCDVLQQYYDRADTSDPLARIQYVDIKTYLTDDILTKVDRASMAVSLEVRAPLLDHKLMERMATMPSGLKLRGGEGKYLFKKAMEPVLPRQVLQRRKQGFCIPVDRWFRRELREFAQEAIFSASAGILNLGYVTRIWQDHQNNTANRAAHLWSLLMFAKWEQVLG
jgi:asparagine synthase (glutamine-hydrolysing)